MRWAVPAACSGDMYHGVPEMTPLSSPPARTSSRARPKSTSTGAPSAVGGGVAALGGSGTAGGGPAAGPGVRSVVRWNTVAGFSTPRARSGDAASRRSAVISRPPAFRLILFHDTLDGEARVITVLGNV